MSLTEQLLKSAPEDLWDRATRHPFLTAAGTGTLSNDLLGLWLAQDRIYAAHAYPRFIGSLIARIPFSSSHALDSAEEKGNKDLLEILAFSLQNVVREVGFFEATAAQYGIPLAGWKTRKGTRDYVAEMARVAAQDSLADALVFLWAMEVVYVEAWRYVAALGPAPDSAARELADNWTCAAFEQFVARLAQLVDRTAGPEQVHSGQRVWERVLELEADFWPSQEETEVSRAETR